MTFTKVSTNSILSEGETYSGAHVSTGTNAANLNAGVLSLSATASTKALLTLYGIDKLLISRCPCRDHGTAGYADELLLWSRWGKLEVRRAGDEHIRSEWDGIDEETLQE